MVDIDAIRDRLERLRQQAAAADVTLAFGISISTVCADLASLITEVEALQMTCEHRHTLQVYDPDGNATQAFACVSCHKVLTPGTNELEPDDGLSALDL